MTAGRMYVAIDFGSTYTKLAALDTDKMAVLGSAYTPTTPGDVRIGLRRGLDDLHAKVGPTRSVSYLVCSSAWGGLRVAVVGLVPKLSLSAATQAALGAGGKIIGSFGRRMSQSDLSAMRESAPDLIILAGGTDGGDEATIKHNAKALANLGTRYPVVVAGNQAVSDRCRDVLLDAGHHVVVTPNILPDVGTVEPQAVREAIRDLFMQRIVQAKGIDRIKDVIGPVEVGVVPTPTAILRAAEVMARDTDAQGAGLGETVIVDVGGATTDMYSAARGAPRDAGILRKGLPEPFVKRTVEGDLGLRVNIQSIVEQCDDATVASWVDEIGSSLDAFRLFVNQCSRQHDYVPRNLQELRYDAMLARAAVGIAAHRHVGTLEEVWGPSGRVLVLRGKDLREVRNVFGIGGVLVRGRFRRFVLEGAMRAKGDAALLPEEPNIWVDSDYVLFGIGLLASADTGAAAAMVMEYLIPSFERNLTMEMS